MRVRGKLLRERSGHGSSEINEPFKATGLKAVIIGATRRPMKGSSGWLVRRSSASEGRASYSTAVAFSCCQSRPDISDIPGVVSLSRTLDFGRPIAT
ncbi:MAG TPA: hypothetical protein VI009_12365, partial [Xanthobacteraceae bacterium]